MKDEELNEIEARADAADIPRLVDEIRQFQPVIEAARQLDAARLKQNDAYISLSRVSEEVKEAEVKLKAAITAL